MKFLITGGAGFIGSHLCDRLAADGHQVHVIDNLSTGRLSNIHHLIGTKGFGHTVGDILEPRVLEPLVAEADTVVHLAAAVGVRLIMERPVETITTNVLGTENVLRACSARDIPVLIASTSEVYGKLMEYDASMTGLREDGDWILGPTSKRRWAYACSKAMDEFLALAYFDEKRLPVIIARFFNTVGPRQTGEYGMVVPSFVQKALLNEPIQVFGDGTQTRCFNHVHDAVDAIVALLGTESAYGEVFNIANELEVSMNELAERVRVHTKSSSEIVHVPYDQVFRRGFEDMRRRTPDLSKLRRHIAYTPSRTIDDIIAQVAENYRHGAV